MTNSVLDQAVYRYIVETDKLTEQQLKQVSDVYRDNDVLYAIVNHPNTTPFLLDYVGRSCNDTQVELIRSIIIDPKTSAETLTYFWYKETTVPKIQLWVMVNPNVGFDILTEVYEADIHRRSDREEWLVAYLDQNIWFPEQLTKDIRRRKQFYITLLAKHNVYDVDASYPLSWLKELYIQLADN